MSMMSSRNMLCSEVERELGMLFSKGGGSGVGTKSKYSGSKFSMVVEDLTEGVLVSTVVCKMSVFLDTFLKISQLSCLLKSFGLLSAYFGFMGM